MIRLSFTSTGIYNPSIIEHTRDLDIAQGWPLGTAEKHSGVSSRRRASAEEPVSMMAAQALMAAAGADIGGIDRLVVTSIMPEQPIPTTAVLVAKCLGLDSGITAYDVNASCLGFLQAVESAATAIAMGRSKRAAVVAAECATLGLDESHRATAGLFGDGAAAAIMTACSRDAGILALRFEMYPEGSSLCEIRAGGSRWNVRRPPPSPKDYLFRMDGMALARMAMDRLPDFINKVLAEAGVSLADIACVIPHQASRLGLKFLNKWLGSNGPVMIDILADHGNQVTVSLPTAMHVAVTQGYLHRGDLGLMVGTAAGFGMGAMVFRY